MKISSLLSLSLCVILLVFASCSPKANYGNRSNKYSKARMKSNNTRPHSKDKGTYAETKKQSETKESTVKPSNSARLTAESKKREEMVSTAQQYIGIPYKYAGKNPAEGFDCSGFANFVYNENDLNTNGPSHDLAKLGVHKEQIDLKAGDLVFFGGENRISHVGMVTKNTKEQTFFIHSSSSVGIKIDEINGSEYWKGKYLFGRDLISEMIQTKYAVNKP
jgi:probable lipoprotein NlpC